LPIQVLPLIITDITFIDERGFFFGCYWGTQNLINTLFTITASYIVADLDWRSVEKLIIDNHTGADNTSDGSTT